MKKMIKVIMVLLSTMSPLLIYAQDVSEGNTREIVESVVSISDSAINMSKAVDELGILAILSSVAIVLMILTYVYLMYQLVSQNGRINEILTNTRDIFDIVSKDENEDASITIEQAKSIIDYISTISRYETVDFIVKKSIFYKNNDDNINIDNILKEVDINNFVNDLVTRNSLELSKYIYKDEKLSKLVDVSDNILLENITSLLTKAIIKDYTEETIISEVRSIFKRLNYIKLSKLN